MKKLFSLSAIAAVLAICSAFATRTPPVYRDDLGQLVTSVYYNGCANTLMPLCATKYINGVEVEHRNTPIP